MMKPDDLFADFRDKIEPQSYNDLVELVESILRQTADEAFINGYDQGQVDRLRDAAQAIAEAISVRG